MKSAPGRAFWFAFVVLHFTVLAAVDLAEARLVAGNPAALHIESESFECGAVAHSDHCVLCQVLATPQDYPERVSFLRAGGREWKGFPATSAPRFTQLSTSCTTLPRPPPHFS